MIASLVFIEPANSAPLSKTEMYGENTQNMRLLQSPLGVEIVDSVGGSEEILVENGALLPLLSTITNTAYKIENSCNPRNDSIEIYRVRQGDTLSDIAEMFCVSSNTIKWANNLSGGIRVGQELTILPISGIMHDIEKGDTIAKLAKKYGGDIEEILAYNNMGKSEKLNTEMSIIVPKGVMPKQIVPTITRKIATLSSGSYTKAKSGYYIKPASGRITSNFGTRRDPISGKIRVHKGTDIANAIGTAIYAAATGKVVEVRSSGWNGGYGKKIVIQHPNGTKTLYAHLNSVSVQVGQRVDQGQQIATMGKTGRVTGTHLHFEIIQGSRHLKPSF